MGNTNFNWGSWQAFWNDSFVQLTLGLIGLVTVSLIALYVLLRLRRINAHNLQIEEEVRKNFEEMRTEGDLNEQEFRKIEALLSKQHASESPTDSKSQTRRSD
jgi:hypothetical protein